MTPSQQWPMTVSAGRRVTGNDNVSNTQGGTDALSFLDQEASNLFALDLVVLISRVREFLPHYKSKSEVSEKLC